MGGEGGLNGLGVDASLKKRPAERTTLPELRGDTTTLGGGEREMVPYFRP